MKVGILTFHCTDNPGSILQAYALQTILMSLGTEPHIVNYQSEGWHKRLDEQYERASKSRLGFFWRPGYYLLQIAERTVYSKYNRFRRDYLNIIPEQAITDCMEMRNIDSYYDRWIVGSDQVWNLKNEKVDYTHFLDFVKQDSKKIAYAPSFGSTDILPEYKEHVIRLLSCFKKISVRESQGAELIKFLIGRDAPVVLDPTLLLNKNQWLKIANLPKEEDYILVYLREKSMLALEKAKELAQGTGLKIVLISPMVMTTPHVGKRVVCPEPRRWLGWFLSAKYVITNSFHGMAFSINFNKQFFAVSLKAASVENDTNSRINSILSQFNLEERLLNVDTLICDIPDINYAYLNECLDAKRASSFEFLSDALFGGKTDENSTL